MERRSTIILIWVFFSFSVKIYSNLSINTIYIVLLLEKYSGQIDPNENHLRITIHITKKNYISSTRPYPCVGQYIYD